MSIFEEFIKLLHAHSKLIFQPPVVELDWMVYQIQKETKLNYHYGECKVGMGTEMRHFITCPSIFCPHETYKYYRNEYSFEGRTLNQKSLKDLYNLLYDVHDELKLLKKRAIETHIKLKKEELNNLIKKYKEEENDGGKYDI